MIINSRKSTQRKRLLLASLALVVIGGIVFLVLQKANIIHTGSLNTAYQNKKQEQAFDTAAKKQFIEQSASSSDSSSSNASASQAPTNPANIKLSAQQNSDSSVTIISKLYTYSDGKCTLTVTNADKTVSQTADVIYQSEFSTCAGFNIPVNQLGTGMWTIKLAVTSKDTTESNTITLEVH